MASRQLPVPSLGLLRFLRSQTENLAFFSPSHGPAAALGPASRGVLCAAAARKPLRASRSAAAADHPVCLQASLFDLERLLPTRTPPAAPPPTRRLRRPQPFAAPAALAAPRWSSTDRAAPPGPAGWEKRPWGRSGGTRKTHDSALKPDDLPESDGDGENNSMFNKRRQLSAKAALEPRLRCTEVDEHGDAVLVDGEFKKSELVARVSVDFPPHDGAPPKLMFVTSSPIVWPPAP